MISSRKDLEIQLLRHKSKDFRENKDSQYLLNYYKINPPPNIINNHHGKSYNYLVREKLFKYMKESDIIIYLNNLYLELEEKHNIKNYELYEIAYEVYKNNYISSPPRIGSRSSRSSSSSRDSPGSYDSYGSYGSFGNESAASLKYKRKTKKQKQKEKQKERQKDKNKKRKEITRKRKRKRN